MKKQQTWMIGFILPFFIFASCQDEQEEVVVPPTPMVSYLVTTAVSPEGAGSVTASATQMSQGGTVTFTATADDNFLFTGWSGGASGETNPITIEITSDTHVQANFTIRPFPEVNLSWPSRMMPRLVYGRDFSSYSAYPYKVCYLDYNKDGWMDIVTANCKGEWGVMNWQPDPIAFYLGQPDGTFIRDSKNDGRIEGLIHVRKIIYGDYNGDNLPDLFFIAHGYDFVPLPGEYCVLLTSSSDGTYTDTRFDETIAFFHGGASGDIDNDGDLDIITVMSYRPIFFINDGTGHFTMTRDLCDFDCIGLFQCELYDINKDGYLDVIMGGNPYTGDYGHIDPDEIPMDNQPLIFWGNGSTFSIERSTRLFHSAVDGFGIVCDFLFHDIDNDGTEEIIIIRTGDDTSLGDTEYYLGWNLQIVKQTATGFIDATSQYIDLKDTYETRSPWVQIIDIAEIGGKKYILGTNEGTTINAFKIMEISNGKLIKVLKEHS